FRDAQPVAVIFEEPASLALPHILDRERARFLEIALEAGAQRLDPILEGTAHHDHAVTCVSGATIVAQGNAVGYQGLAATGSRSCAFMCSRRWARTRITSSEIDGKSATMR